ncbi:MAG TPA: M48 family metallopeptidase [Terriglobales bacterium]
MPMNRTLRRQLACILVFTVTVFAAEPKPNDDPKKGRVTANPSAGSFTFDQEIQIGQQGAREVEKQMKVLPADHPMSKFVAQLGAKLASKAPGYAFPYTFKVVNEKSVNAFALPGGPIFIHTGLIADADEDEVAGVMGHEISHVVMRHSARQQARAMKAQLPLAILGAAVGAGVGGMVGGLAQMGISLTAGSVFMKYSRDAEVEADMVGAQIIYDAGYDPQAVVTFFLKLKQQTGGQSSGPSFLASHPDPGDRAKNIQSILSRFPPKQYQTANSPEFVAAKASLANLSAGTTAVPPTDLKRLNTANLATGNWKTYQHQAFTVSYPESWQFDGGPSSGISFWPNNGAANGVIAYGTIISGFQPRDKKKDLDVAFNDLQSDLRESNPELQVYSSPQAFTLNGRAARKLDWSGNSAIRENGAPIKERVRLVAAQAKSGIVIYMVFVSPEPDMAAMSPIFDRIMNSLQLR